MAQLAVDGRNARLTGRSMADSSYDEDEEVEGGGGGLSRSSSSSLPVSLDAAEKFVAKRLQPAVNKVIGWGAGVLVGSRMDG